MMTIGRHLKNVAAVKSAIVVSALFAARCGGGEALAVDPQAEASRSATVAQTCTAQDLRAFPLQGTICGGSTVTSGCEPGALYRCKSGARGQTNNCTLQTVCAIGCGTTSNHVDACYTGPAPLTVSPSTTTGGDEVTATVTLTEAHPRDVIDNMKIDRGDLVAARAFCNVRDIPAGSSSVTFNMPTAAVSSQTGVRAYTLLSFVTPSGFSREVVSRPAVVTLNPGGTTPPPPPLASFTMSPSTIGPGGQSLIDVVLTHMAPAEALPGQQGTTVQVTSSNPSVVSVSTNALPVVQPGCATGGGAFTLHAANQVPQQTVVDITANSGTGASVTNPITVTAGCVPKSCLDIPANQCRAPDGCGGTMACGCPQGGTCGADGTCQVVQTVGLSSVTLNPSSVKGGTSSTGTATLNMPAAAGGVA